MPVDEALQRLHEVEMEGKVRGVGLRSDAGEVGVHIRVDVVEGRGRLALVVHGRVEREGLVQHLDKLGWCCVNRGDAGGNEENARCP